MNHPVKLILIKPDGTRVPLSIQVKNAFELYARMLQKCTCYGHTVVVYSFKGITPDVYSVTNVGDCQWELDSADIHAFRIGEYDE